MTKAPLLSPGDQWQIYDNEVSDELGRATLCQAQRDADHEFYQAQIREIFAELGKPCYHGKRPLRVGECHQCMRELKARFVEGRAELP